MNTQSPFHPGEQAVQNLANESDMAQRNGVVITDTILPGAIPFITQQSMLVVTSVDTKGDIWTSVLMGRPGFISASDAHNLILDRDITVSNTHDSFWKNIQHSPNIGLLVIELSTRRRFRINGTVEALSDTQVKIHVDEAYPNCPKYIQRRQPELDVSDFSDTHALPLQGRELQPEHIQLIESSDSMFVGSAVAEISGDPTHYRADASHRGGNPGFIEIIKPNTLRIPDYRGNSLFNTLGNIQAYPKAGLVFIDFERGALLQVSGTANILWQQDDPNNKTGGTQRYWELDITAWQETALPERLSWQFFDYSPHNPRHRKSGTADERLNLKVSKLEQKSDTITRYRLSAMAGGVLPAFEAGAHLPVSVTLPNGRPAERHYSILSSPHDNRFYDIAVQREDSGKGGSQYIHKQLKVNATLKAKAPVNAFPLATRGEHTILIAGGIGITPILSMLRILVEDRASFEIHYTARTLDDLAFAKDVFELAGDRAHLYTSQENNSATELAMESGRLKLEEVLHTPHRDTHVYLCGPVKMIDAVREVGEKQGWQTNQIHFESFGASNSKDDTPISVRLLKSSMVVQVQAQQTILDALLEAKVPVPFDCKRGECGMCATPVLDGEIVHRDVYLNKEERPRNMCVCVSRVKGEHLTLDL